MARITISLETAPPTPAAGTVVVYAKTSGLWVKDELGAERQIDLEINDAGTGTRDLWSASKIIAELAVAGGDVKSGVVPVGAKDGVNDTFTLPGSDKYRFDSLAVFLNGQQYDTANITKTGGPNYNGFVIVGDNLPNSSLGDSFSITYMIDI